MRIHNGSDQYEAVVALLLINPYNSIYLPLCSVHVRSPWSHDVDHRLYKLLYNCILSYHTNNSRDFCIQLSICKTNFRLRTKNIVAHCCLGNMFYLTNSVLANSRIDIPLFLVLGKKVYPNLWVRNLTRRLCDKQIRLELWLGKRENYFHYSK